MSLDISIYATPEVHSDDFITFDDISRAFCSLIRSLSEGAENCELKQIAVISNVDITVLRAMSTWETWQKQYGGFPTVAEEQAFSNEYNTACDQSWQHIDSVLNVFTALHESLMHNLLFESRITYKLEWLSTYGYFRNFDEDVAFNGRPMDKNFGWDLRNIIRFLHSAKQEKMKFVRFQLS